MIVRQGVEQVTLSGDLRRFFVPLAARHVVAGGISPPQEIKKREG
jgi:hypothetical protein